MCGHIHDTTTRYDRAERLLTFLLVCPVCGTEKVVETLDYEPRRRDDIVPQPDSNPRATPPNRAWPRVPGVPPNDIPVHPPRLRPAA
jgi:hypothetical protein